MARLKQENQVLINYSEMTVNYTVMHYTAIHYITLWNTLQHTAVQTTEQGLTKANVIRLLVLRQRTHCSKKYLQKTNINADNNLKQQ